MRTRFHPAVFVMFLACVILWGCPGHGNEPASTAVFRINGAEEDSYASLSPQAQSFQIDVSLSEGEWTWYIVGGMPEWVHLLREQDVGQEKGCIVLEFDELEERLSRSIVVVFQAGQQIRKLTIKQTPPDPFLGITTPGAYGMAGGDEIAIPNQSQTGVFSYPEGFSFRILTPSLPKAVILSFPQRSLTEGETTDIHYRVVERGITTQSKTLSSVEVLRISGGMAWLRLNEDTGFIVLIPES